MHFTIYCKHRGFTYLTMYAPKEFIFLLMLHSMTCEKIFIVNIDAITESNIDSQASTKKIELRVTSRLRQYTFLLTRRQKKDRTVPVFTHDGKATRNFDLKLPQNTSFYDGNTLLFMLKIEEGVVVYCTGFFEDSRHTYNVRTQPVNTAEQRFIMKRHNKLRQKLKSFRTIEQPTQRHNKTTSHTSPLPHPELYTMRPHKITTSEVEILKIGAESHRHPRQIQLYEIELLLAVDFSLFKQMTRKSLRFLDTPEQYMNIEELTHEILVIVNGIDSRFRNIRGGNYMVDVVLAGIFVAQNASASPWSESIKKPVDSRHIINEGSLNLFIEWTKENQDILPEFDHAMAMTAYNLRNKDNHKTLGLGYKQSMCTDRRYSIIEHHGNVAYVSYIATHELAHSLGAKHDGYPVTVAYGERRKSCQANDGFIMSPIASSNPDILKRSWSFSECSRLYFDFFIDHLNENRTNCMTSSNQVITSHQYVSIVTSYTADEQCERTHGLGFVLDRVSIYRNPSSICQSLPCKNVAAKSRKNTLPLAGTRCGIGKTCHLGECVEDQHFVGNQSIEDDCIFGDQPGRVRADGITCKSLRETETAHECYTFARECCETCKFHLRRYTKISSCEYGDKKESCSARDCEENLCCETCAILKGLLTECTPQAMSENVVTEYNTKNIHQGVTAMFSCTPGHVLTGNVTSVCLESGTWSSSPPICVNGCLNPILKITAHAHLYSPETIDLFTPLSGMNFQCLSGFTLKGPPVVVCLPQSTWNDSIPTCVLEFTSPSTMTILENTPPGTVIHILTTGNASSYFKLLYFSHPGLKVTNDGRLLVDDGHVIDYEQTRSYTIIVEATSVIDSRFKATQRIMISVNDVNEFAPQFSEGKVCIEMTQPLEQDPLIRRVYASDLDLHSTNITYDMDRSIDYADIDHVTGELSVSSAHLLNLADSSSFVFQIYAVDSGLPQMTGTCTVEIKLDTPCAGSNNTSGCTNTTLQCFCCLVMVAILSCRIILLNMI